jgi:membrane-associated phospholipid phosphatase
MNRLLQLPPDNPLTEPQPFTAGLAEIWRACSAFEWVTFAYLAWLNAMLVLFHRHVAHAGMYVVVHSWLCLGIICLCWSAAHSEGRVLRFLRHWYPLPLYVAFFEELGGLVHLIFPGWFDRWLIEFDFGFAGVHPALWLARFSSPAMNEFMQLSYMTYFLYLVLLPAILYSQRDRLAYWNVMVSTAVAHYSVYVIAVLFPIESPFHTLASLPEQPHAAGYFTTTIDLIERFARVHGAAFPSAHVAGSMVAVLAAYRYRRWLFWVCLPFFSSMCVATVYGRYHYVADVLAGIAVGAIGFAAGSWLMERKGALPAIAEESGPEINSTAAAACATPSPVHTPTRWPAGAPRTSAAQSVEARWAAPRA